VHKIGCTWLNFLPLSSGRQHSAIYDTIEVCEVRNGQNPNIAHETSTLDQTRCVLDLLFVKAPFRVAWTAFWCFGNQTFFIIINIKDWTL